MPLECGLSTRAGNHVSVAKAATCQETTVISTYLAQVFLISRSEPAAHNAKTPNPPKFPTVSEDFQRRMAVGGGSSGTFVAAQTTALT